MTATDRKKRSHARKKRSAPDYAKIVALPDLHQPYADPAALSTALAFVRNARPDIVVVLGDWIDFYQLSRFVADPGRKLELQADIDACHQSLSELRKSAPVARIVYLQGNHEHRLTKHLWGTQSPLASLRGLRVPELLGLGELGIVYAESGREKIGAVLFKHGNIVRPRSCYSASAELDKLWTSGVSGHTHRLGQVYRTNDSGSYTWIESGCLCNLQPEYAEGQTVDWQHGLSYIEVARGGRNRFRAEAVPIVKGKITWGGKDIS